MTPEHFDRLSRALARSGSRRLLLVGLAAPALVAPSTAVARKHETRSGKKSRNRERRKDRDKDKKKGKGKNKNSGNGCKNRYSEQQILSLIGKAAKKYGQSKSVMIRVARCESGLDPCAVNNSGPYYGLYQYLKSTWKSTPYSNESIWDPRAQAMATGWMWKQGRKNEWACK